MQNIINQLKQRGYNGNIEFSITIENIKFVLEQMKNNQASSKHFKLHKEKESTVLKEGQEFMSRFRLHPILEDKGQEGKMRKVEEIHPFQLPVLFKEENPFYGMTHERIYPKQEVLTFVDISLSKQITEQTSISYVHELTHTQIDGYFGLVEEYYNAEMLSIFLELVSALEKGHERLELADQKRIQDFLAHYYRMNTIEIAAVIESRKYFQSIWNAYGLFSLYYFGSVSLRKELLKEVQKIFSLEQSVEEYLKKYEIATPGQDNETHILKYFNKKM